MFIPAEHLYVPVTRVANYAFAVCRTIRTVYLPSTVTEVGHYAFFEVYAKNLDLPEGLQKVGNYAFGNGLVGNNAVKNIPESLIEIGDGAFSKCTALEFVSISDEYVKLQPNEYQEQTVKLGDYIFDGCTSLGAVELPEGLFRNVRRSNR